MRTAVRPGGRAETARTGASRARRIGAPSWRDPRLLVGLALVLGSVVAGARVVTAAQATTGVYAVGSAVGAGQPVSAGALRVVQVHLDEATAGAYLGAGEELGAGAVALRGLPAGELLPRSAIGRVGDLTARPVSVPLEGPPPAGVAVGALVDVWVVRESPASASTSAAVPEEPQQLAEAAEVSAVAAGGTGLSARSGADVQVLVPRGALPRVLQALTDGADIVLVPVPGAGRGAA
ncbi:hypothetical protein GTQ99_16580 [Kineococcus sp. T13]|uniref:hypothetical protein n=1 Tax=Kineococcus vitellinus TaxID=2696565 RepID=UPI001412C2D1|nr:hypothetical protein [Kineococcus vitellinus]NAZ77026.1 hypothetical protein [Kineococcus vitellinus]